MTETFVYYAIIVSGEKRDFRTSRNKAEVSKLVAGYKRVPKVTRVMVRHGTKNNMKTVSDWTR